jgi:alkylation response protein AidB-like acyl-CoA dehydrogenase
MDEALLKSIRDRAGPHDLSGEWPSEDLDALAAVGAMRWAVPKAFGGEEISPLDLHLRYERIASASISTALILTQRDSSVALIDGSDNAQVKQSFLPKLAENQLFGTVGIAQLTTSHQEGPPALVARRGESGWLINGQIPWSSGADRARYIVSGAVVDEPVPQQILFILSTSSDGVRLSPPMPLVALSATHTCSVCCDNLMLEDRFILRGPVDSVLAGRKRTLPIGQAFLAMGLCAAGIDLIDQRNSDLARETSREFRDQLENLRQRVIEYCNPEIKPDPAGAPQLRGECNSLALRITHAAVALHKGSGLAQGHPAQRLAREALFLLVWSCPSPVVDCTVELLRTCRM